MFGQTRQRIHNLARKSATRFMDLEVRHSRVGDTSIVGRNVEGLDGVTFGGYNFVAHSVTFDGPVSLGLATTINPYCQINGPTTIGAYCQFAPQCGIFPANHPTNYATIYTNGRLFDGRLQQLATQRTVTIGHGVWLGMGSVVLSGVTVGNGAVIGANAVVTRDVDPYEIVAGAPARRLRIRLPQASIALLEESSWWKLRPDELEPFEEFFVTALDPAATSPTERVVMLSRQIAERARSVRGD